MRFAVDSAGPTIGLISWVAAQLSKFALDVCYLLNAALDAQKGDLGYDNSVKPARLTLMSQRRGSNCQEYPGHHQRAEGPGGQEAYLQGEIPLTLDVITSQLPRSADRSALTWEG